ncbi:hypothetical protein K0M31_010131, partial [Melipona bicolor]
KKILRPVNKFAIRRKRERLQGWHRSRRRNSLYEPDVRMAETRDRSNFFDDSVRKKTKKKEKEPREREERSKMRGEKSDPLTVRGLLAGERGTGNYKSTFMSHGVILQRLEEQT